LSTVASLLAVSDAFADSQKSTFLHGFFPWTLVCIGLLAMALWWPIRSELQGISDLGETQIPDSPVDIDSTVSAL
jgi:hypothetical protein